MLNPALGGPPVYPPAPEFLFKPPASYGPKVWNEDKGPNRYRRALYTFRFRSVPYPVLTNFDAPNGDASCVRRARSNTPLQALTTLNEPLFLECARGLALKVLGRGRATDRDRLVFAFRRCTGRKPTERETDGAARLPEKTDGEVLRPRRQTVGAGRQRPEQTAAIAGENDAGAGRGLDGGGAVVVESG